MTAVSAPYGLLPVNLIGGQVYAGSTREYAITTASATSIFYGDVVKMVNDGSVGKDVGTDAATPVGVFLGCSYTDATYGKTFRQYFPGGTVAADIKAVVADDPRLVFKVAVVSATTTISGMTQTCVGTNGILVQNTGSTITGNSKNAILNTSATTSTFPVRIIGYVPESETTTAGSYSEVLVTWNAGMHAYDNATGV